jgi:NAD(P)-dependent dehydrogenase (short-subunit alcohol dehydrogenase family)
MTTTPLAGRTALVTGSGNGLGRAMTQALVDEGVRVVLVGRTKTTLEETAELVGGDTRVAACDVSDADQVNALATELDGEEVSILVNNAGIGGPVKALVHVSPEEWDEVQSANVRSVFLMCRAFLPRMVAAGRGDVVNLASVSGKRPLVRRTPYTASKLAIIGLTRTLAYEVGPAGVSVNTLSPGPVRGPRMARNFRLEAQASGSTVAEAERAFVSRAALERLVEEDEVGAALVAMLRIPGLCGADIDLSAGMVAPA